MVKLFFPAAGAAGGGVFEVATAGVAGLGFAGGADVCANAVAVEIANSPITRCNFIEFVSVEFIP
jgi:hypothetical protein